MLSIGNPTTSFPSSIKCSAVLRELEQIWNEIGESEMEKDRMLLEVERECLEVCRRKVDEAATTKARLHQSVAAKEAELATLMAALGELNIQSPISAEKRSSPLKEKLSRITPLVDDLKLKKEERLKQFTEIRSQIEKLSGEISGYCNVNGFAFRSLPLEEQDLSLRKLTEYQTHLNALQKEKSQRLHKVLDHVNEVHFLCSVLGLNLGQTVSEVHPSLHETNLEQSTNISDSTLDDLQQTILRLKTERKARVCKLKDTVAMLFDLWKLMDSPMEEKNDYLRIAFILRSPESEITERGVLSTEMMEQALAEVDRLTKIKASRMKELVLERRSELEELCKMIHIEADTSTAAEKSTALIDSGLVDPSELLSNIEAQILKVKDEASSRKEIVDRIDKWLSACEEENWLEQYNKDEMRYSAGRGAHINLKRAEKARVATSKIPAMVDNLINRTLAWEREKNEHFFYDGVRLVSILDDYKLTRQQKEEEKRKLKYEKKIQDLLLNEKEAMYGSKSSPRKNNSFKKTNSFHSNGNGSMPPTPRRNSVGSATANILTPRSYSARQNGFFKETRRLSVVPLNFVAVPKEDTMSFASLCSYEPESPPQTQTKSWK